MEDIIIKNSSDVKKVLVERKYPYYIYRKELISPSYPPGKPFEVKRCYARNNGVYIGEPRMARLLVDKYGITEFYKAHEKDTIVSIGFSERDQKWYGWSHRAISGFGVGTVVQTRNGNKKLISLTDAKNRAKQFAKSVS